MIYLLDSNICIAYLNNALSPVRAEISALRPADLALCSVVKSELLCGAEKSSNPAAARRVLHEFFAPYVSLPFDDQAASTYGRIRAKLESDGRPIGPYDLQIASIALTRDLILVTHNTREFRRVDGLKIEDWEAAE